jgi:hypothetical protein
MAQDKRTLARWGLACGGPILGSLAITGLLALGIPALLGGASQHPGDLGDPSPPGAVPVEMAAMPPTATSLERPAHPQTSRRVEAPMRRPYQATVRAPHEPAFETAAWMEEEQQRLTDLERQQTNYLKTVVDMAHAARGIDTTMLTFEEISGGRHLRGRSKFLADQAARARGEGGAPGTSDDDLGEPPAADVADEPGETRGAGPSPPAGERDDAPDPPESEADDQAGEPEIPESEKGVESGADVAQGGQGADGPENGPGDPK